MSYKKLFLSLIILSVFIPIFTSANFENQWFKIFNESDWKIDFTCDSQCFLLAWEYLSNDTLSINLSISWNWVIWYGFLVWQQFAQWELIQVNSWNINYVFEYNKIPFLSQIPNNAKVLLVFDWKISWKIFNISISKNTLLENFSKWINQALQYIPFNPRTINFLEWPLWNWRYINHVFFPYIVFLLFITTIFYFVSNKKNKYIYVWFWILLFFWFIFDFFSTLNQINIFKEFNSSQKIINNWRLAKDSDFYDFLDFIRKNTKNKEKWFFISPYPFDSEWKFHIYPEIKFDSIDKVKYLFWYNPMWKNVLFGFKDPIYNNGEIKRDNKTFKVVNEIIWKDYAKIYVLE